MKRLFSLILSATVVVAAVATLPDIASAAPHARVAPLDCRTMAAKVGSGNVWQARFNGMRRSLMRWRLYERTYAIGCFRTQAACVDWLYWEQSDWPYQNSAGRCRRGMPYGL